VCIVSSRALGGLLAAFATHHIVEEREWLLLAIVQQLLLARLGLATMILKYTR